MYKEYQRMIILIKPNDVIYSRDLHAVDIMNKIIMDKNIDPDLKDELFVLFTKLIDKSNIKYHIHPEFNLFMLMGNGWDDLICNKANNFVFKDFYIKLKENGLEKLIYNTKLTYWNSAQLENIELNSNFIILNDDFIDDIKLLSSNGIDLTSKGRENIVNNKDLIDYLIKNVSFRDSDVYLYLNIFTSSIDDLLELYNKVKDNEYLKSLLKNVKINMMFITLNKYNESKIEYYNSMNVPPYGLLNIFDKYLISKLKTNKNM